MMSQSITSQTLSLPALSKPELPDESITRVAAVGWVIIAIFFGLFGTWAAIAPLKGAVVANGLIKVEGNRKSVQHLEGGIVKELRVKEGDRVTAGDIVIVLDPSQARAEHEVLSQDLIVLRATEERLRAELTHRAEMTIPDDLKAFGDDRYVKEVRDAQVHQMEVRLTALEGQRQVIKEKIAQLEYQIVR